MSNLQVNTSRLYELDEQVATAREALAVASEALSEAEYRLTIKRESEIFKAKYEDKLADTTAKAKATMLCAEELRAQIVAEGKWKRAKIKLDNLIDQKSTVMEDNYNIRAEMKVFQG